MSLSLLLALQCVGGLSDSLLVLWVVAGMTRLILRNVSLSVLSSKTIPIEKRFSRKGSSRLHFEVILSKLLMTIS